MARRSPKMTAPPPICRSSTRVRFSLDLCFITPVLGGGVEPHRHDPISPVRVPSIRGCLRWWWRALNPAGCTTLAELAAREGRVFGSANRAAGNSGDGDRRGVRIQVVGDLKPPVAVPLPPLGHWLSYGAFPLRGVGREPDGSLWNFGAQEISIVVDVPSHAQDEVEAAALAWASFGGLGARTRRGFGAIALTNGTLGSFDWDGRVREQDVPWPHLRRSLPPLELRSKNAERAHETLLGGLKTFRQGNGVGRRPPRDGGFAGRSYWPEPDEIRRLSSRPGAPRHRTPVSTIAAFPRAAFGLPIEVKFKDDRDGDPEKSTIKPVGKDRLASGLLLRPARDASGNFFARAIRVAHPPPPRGVEIKIGQVVHPDLRTFVTADEAASIHPLVVSGEPIADPIEAFFAFLTLRESNS